MSSSPWFNEDQCGGHDEIGGCLSAIRGPMRRGEAPDPASVLRCADTIEKEVKALRKRLEDVIGGKAAAIRDAEAAMRERCAVSLEAVAVTEEAGPFDEEDVSIERAAWWTAQALRDAAADIRALEVS